MLGVALSGCALAAPAALPDGLEVSLVQLRGDISPGRVQVHIENGSGAALTVTAASLRSPVLASAAAWDSDRPETLAAGRTVNLPVPLPAVVCSDDDPAATVMLTVDGGEVEAPLPDELGVLAGLAATECAREAVEAVARVEATGVVANDDGTAGVQLSITPTGDGDGAVRLVALRGTPLLHYASGEQWPLDLEVAAGDVRSTATALVVPRRCDPHAIAEDKVGTRLQLVAEVGGKEVVYPLPRAATITGELLAFAASACGLTP